MKADDIAFVKLVGIKQDEKSVSLDYKKDVLNHIESIHASAQFTLAETQSGLHLQELFPDLAGKVIPILRESKIKYKKPALKQIVSSAFCVEEDIQKFREQFDKKGRGSLLVSTEVKDIEGTVTANAEFTWFIQKI